MTTDYTRPEPETIREFRDGFRGETIRPGDEGYDDARTVYNAMIDRHPAIVARCTGVADVIAAVNFAREHDLPLAVRGGGHSIAGSSVCDDGIVADLSAMNGVLVDPDARTAYAQAGATWGDVDRETQAFGLVTPGGVVSTTGVAGLTLGGGYSNVRRKYGLTVDNLRSVDIVTADGEFLTASEERNRELFWALRGGGGNFGVVTGFEYDLHELGPEVAVVTVMYPIETASAVLREWREFMDGAPDEITSQAPVWSVPEHPNFPEEHHGTPVLVVGGMYAGPVAEGKRAMRPLRELGTPLVDLSGSVPYTRAQQALDPFFPKGVFRSYWKSRYLARLDDDAIETIVEYASARPSPRTIVPVRARGGRINRVDTTATAFPDRHSPFLLSIDSTWEDPVDDAANIEWTREFWDALEPYSSDSRYYNFSMEEDGEGMTRTTFGENYERLVEVKTEYDPGNLFRLNQNIVPAG
jgi:FAD/FMN-containing dehydrogenase